MAKSQQRRVTTTTVAALKPGDIIRDPQVRGFGVRHRGGTASYFLQTRINRRLRWLTIGKHGSPWTPALARVEALRLLTDIADGQDPSTRKRKRREIPTIDEASDDFLETHGATLKDSTRTEYARLFRTAILPKLGKRSVKDVDRADAERLLAAYKAAPRKANHAIAVLSKLMSWCETEGLREPNTNPCHKMRKYPERMRQRFLSDEELERLGDVLARGKEVGEDPYVVAAIRFLLLSGARLSEVLTLEWRFLDMQRGLANLPDSKTGQKTLFLSPPAVELLAKLPKDDGNPFVFVSSRSKEGRLINLQKPWRRIRARAELEDVRLHDLRHSFASIAAASGASLYMIGRLLGHSRAQTTARYAHLVSDQVRDLNDEVGARISSSLARSD